MHRALEVGGLQIDMTRHQISSGEKELRLSRTEFDLLRLLAENTDRVIAQAPRSSTSIWGSAAYIDTNIVDQYVSYVRRKLDRGRIAVRIVTARGVGLPTDAGESVKLSRLTIRARITGGSLLIAILISIVAGIIIYTQVERIVADGQVRVLESIAVPYVTAIESDDTEKTRPSRPRAARRGRRSEGAGAATRSRRP